MDPEDREFLESLVKALESARDSLREMAGEYEEEQKTILGAIEIIKKACFLVYTSAEIVEKCDVPEEVLDRIFYPARILEDLLEQLTGEKEYTVFLPDSEKLRKNGFPKGVTFGHGTFKEIR